MNEEKQIEARIIIERSLYNEVSFENDFTKKSKYVGYQPLDEVKDTIKSHCFCGLECVKKQVYNRLPIIKWIKKYKIKECLLSDLLTGFTIGIMHIPQGMAYSLLATLPPIYGLYTSFFPVLIYMIFGTSKHISIGSFAFASLMIARTIVKLENKMGLNLAKNETFSSLGNDSLGFNVTTNSFIEETEKIKVSLAMAVTFYVGLVQLVMCVLQLGFLTNYLAEPLVNGLTTGVAVQVVVSQLKSVFGVKLKQFSGVFNLIRSLQDFFTKITKINVPTMIVSFLCMAFLFIMKTQVNERFEKKMIVPVPIELIVVILGTVVSYTGNLKSNFNISIVGSIPAGFKMPQVPNVSLFQDVILEASIVAFVIFATNISQANTFARKHKYKINSNQELFAYGTSNLVTSFFFGFVSAASLARSSVQENAGGKTQIVSFFSCILVAVVLLVLAPLFQSLPQACLAAIILVSLKSVLLQITQLNYYWKVNKLEFLLWLVTFLSIIILDVDIGLAIGFAFYIISFFIRSSRPYITTLGNMPGTELYKDIELYSKAREIKGIKIIRAEHSIYAINSDFIKKSIYQLSDVKPEKYATKLHKYEKKLKKNKNKDENELETLTINKTDLSNCDTGSQDIKSFEHPKQRIIVNIQDLENEIYPPSSEHFKNDEEVQHPLKDLPIHHLIIDCSPINYTDSVGVKILSQLIKDYNEINIQVYLAECRDSFENRIREMENIQDKTKKHQNLVTPNIIFQTVHDAVIHALLAYKNSKH